MGAISRFFGNILATFGLFMFIHDAAGGKFSGLGRNDTLRNDPIVNEVEGQQQWRGGGRKFTDSEREPAQRNSGSRSSETGQKRQPDQGSGEYTGEWKKTSEGKKVVEEMNKKYGRSGP